MSKVTRIRPSKRSGVLGLQFTKAEEQADPITVLIGLGYLFEAIERATDDAESICAAGYLAVVGQEVTRGLVARHTDAEAAAEVVA